MFKRLGQRVFVRRVNFSLRATRVALRVESARCAFEIEIETDGLQIRNTIFNYIVF